MPTHRPSIKSRAGVVHDPHLWARQPGYEFRVYWGHDDIQVVMGNSNDGLSGHGWWIDAASLNFYEGSNADLLDITAADRQNPTYLGLFNSAASGNYVLSPRIFGSYDHALQASRFLGYMPTKLCFEASIRQINFFNAPDGGHGWGFNTRANPIAITPYDTGAGYIWRLVAPAGTVDGPTKDDYWHVGRIEIDASNIEMFIDDVSYGTLATPGDIWPVPMLISAPDSGATLEYDTAWCRVYYA